MVRALGISEEEWVDLQFEVTEVDDSHPEALVLRVEAMHADRRIGFELGFPKQWDHTPEGAVGDFGAYQSTLAIVSRSGAGDSFLATLSALYENAAPATAMRPITEAYAISLEGNPEIVKTSPARLKLFFGWEEGSATPYGELYLNLDLPNRVLGLNEKDPEYRPAILAALGA